MQYTVIGAWHDDEPLVAGRHEVYGGDAEWLAKTEAIENSF